MNYHTLQENLKKCSKRVKISNSNKKWTNKLNSSLIKWRDDCSHLICGTFLHADILRNVSHARLLDGGMCHMLVCSDGGMCHMLACSDGGMCHMLVCSDGGMCHMLACSDGGMCHMLACSNRENYHCPLNVLLINNYMKMLTL